MVSCALCYHYIPKDVAGHRVYEVMSHGVMCIVVCLYTECRRRSQGIWSNVTWRHVHCCNAYIPHAVAGHRECGIMYLPIQSSVH